MEASNVLQATPYARKIPPSEEIDTWESYILQVLKALRTADKSNWHHRMVARVGLLPKLRGFYLPFYRLRMSYMTTLPAMLLLLWVRSMNLPNRSSPRR